MYDPARVIAAVPLTNFHAYLTCGNPPQAAGFEPVR